MPNLLVQKVPLACPTCGKGVESLSFGGWHAHKELGRRETVSFECGCTLEYVPNFSRVETKTPCNKQLTLQTVKLQFDLDLQVVKPVDVDQLVASLKLRPEVDYYAADRNRLTGNMYIKDVRNLQRV